KLQIEAPLAEWFCEVDVPVVLQLRCPTILSRTFAKQEIVMSNACFNELPKDVPSQNKSHTVCRVVGVKALLQQKHSIPVAKAELSSHCFAIQVEQPEFQSAPCQERAAQIVVELAAHRGGKCTRFSPQ